MKFLDSSKLREYAKASKTNKQNRRKITNGSHMDPNNKKKSKSQVYKLIYLGNKRTLPKRKY